jgi:hypothetical protein
MLVLQGIRTVEATKVANFTERKTMSKQKKLGFGLLTLVGVWLAVSLIHQELKFRKKLK